jgi:2',3'-cyclic-nucleotide 2'-phosphodiesterase (5'-nucleotidase family)
MKRTQPFFLLAAMLAVFLTGAAPASDVLEVDVLYTSDIHGHIDRGHATFLNPNFPPPLGGGASAAAYIERVRKEAEAAGRPVLLFDSGDIFQGTPVGMKTEGTAVVEHMNRAGYDAMAIGNHEFDLGWQNIRRLSEMAEFPMLGANIIDTETGERVPWAGDYVILERGGMKFGVIGYVTETTANMSFGKNVEGIEFLPIHEMLPGHIADVRAEGADLVFVLMHQGLPYKPELEQEYGRMKEREAEGGLPHWGMNAMEVAHTIWGIDAIFAGHTHQGYDDPWQDPRTHTLVFEPYANGSSIGHVTMRIDRATKQILGYETHFGRGTLLTLFEEEIWPDHREHGIIMAQVGEAEKGLDLVIGETVVNLERGSANNALMGFVMADAYREEMEADFALQNTGGVRANIPPGRITERDLLAVSPFGNQMVIVEMTGEFLRQILEDKLRGRGGGVFFSGGKVRYDLALPDGERIIEFTKDGAPVDPEREYRVAMTNYLAEGNSGLWRLRELPSEKVLYTGYQDREVLSRYIQKKEVLNPSNDGRWVKVDSSS